MICIYITSDENMGLMGSFRRKIEKTLVGQKSSSYGRSIC